MSLNRTRSVTIPTYLGRDAYVLYTPQGTQINQYKSVFVVYVFKCMHDGERVHVQKNAITLPCFCFSSQPAPGNRS